MAKKEYEIIEHRSLNDVNLFIVELTYRNLHMHNDFELCLVLDGQARVFANNKTTTHEKGSIIIFNPNQPHEIQTINDEKALLLSLQFSAKFCARYFHLIKNIEFTKIECKLTSLQKEEMLKTLFSLAKHYFKQSEFFELLVYAHLNLLAQLLVQYVPWYRLSEEEKSAKVNICARLNRVIDYIDNNFSNKIVLSDIACEEGVSLSYLSRFFKNHLNMTFQDYVSLLRFEEALLLIEQTDMNITDICMASGFSDQRYMNRQFQKRLRCNPSEYKTRVSKNQIQHNAQSKTGKQRILNNTEALAILEGQSKSIFQSSLL